MQINANHHAQYLALQVLDVCPEPQTTTVCQGLGPGHPQRSFRIMMLFSNHDRFWTSVRHGPGSLAAWQDGLRAWVRQRLPEVGTIFWKWLQLQ